MSSTIQQRKIPVEKMIRQIKATKTDNYWARLLFGERRHHSSIIFARWQHASRCLSWGALETLRVGGRGDCRVSAMVPFERAMVVSYTLQCNRCANSNHSVTICDRMSPTLKLTGPGLVTLWQNLGSKGLTKPNFKAIWERHKAVVCKRNRIDIFCRLTTMHEHDRQTTER